MRLPITFGLVGLLTLAGCATNSKSRWALIGIAAPVGGVIGAATTPKDERQDAHAVYGAALLTVAAAVVGNLIYSDDADLNRLKSENEALEKKNHALENPVLHLLEEGNGSVGNSGKTSSKGDGHWKRYKVDTWVHEGPNKIVHENEIIEILPVEQSK